MNEEASKKRRITISRLMAVVAVAAFDSWLAKALARAKFAEGAYIFALVVFYDAAAFFVIIAFGKIRRRKPGDLAQAQMGCLVSLMMLLFPCLVMPLLVLLDELLTR